MIVATAGHVDHGKTLLVKALTGVDADRLPEEKRRGLTIDLGVRYEDATQTVAAREIFDNQVNIGAATNLENDYWLPAGTITYQFDNGLQLLPGVEGL